jgi:2-(1,2-epoxy-1,2-dihydrophenyl)acetyl-CoA isomerase
MAFETLIVEQRDQVAWVTLDRPDKLNALNSRLIAELHAAAAAIDADPRVRAVLLTGAGRAFSSGADLTAGDFGDPARTPGENVGAHLREHFNPMMSAWHGLRVPVVVAVNGAAAGAGMSLALVGDIVLAARSATFLQLFAPKLGLLPDLGSTFYLPRLVGTARAKGLALLGDALPAADAERWGLIWGCVEDAALLPQAGAIAARLAAGPTQAYRRIKAVFDREPAGTLAEQLAVEAALQAELADTDDFAEGLRAFHARRAPNFGGT